MGQSKAQCDRTLANIFFNKVSLNNYVVKHWQVVLLHKLDSQVPYGKVSRFLTLLLVLYYVLLIMTMLKVMTAPCCEGVVSEQR